MANEISVTAALSIFKPSIMGSAIGRSFPGTTQFTMSDNFFTEGTIQVGITPTAIPLGQVAAPHWAWFRNLDATNYLTIRNGAGGADLIQLLPGEFALVPVYFSATPYALANNAPVQMEYLIADF